jgi:hypothetical protein
MRMATATTPRLRTRRRKRFYRIELKKARSKDRAFCLRVIPGRAKARTRNLELFISGFRVRPH